MAATKLNPAATPFPYPYALHLGPPALPPFPLAGACPTPPPIPLAGACPTPPFPFTTYGCVASTHGHLHLSFPVQPSPPVLCKSVPASATHGLPPHKFMLSGPCGVEKLQAAAAVAKNPRKGPPASATAAAAAPAHVPAPHEARLARQKAERGRSKAKAYRPRKASGPRARRAAQRTRSPSPAFTWRPRPWLKLPPAGLGSCTTVMVRNIPNKLRSKEMIALLDEHCARANEAAGAVVSAYDVLYLPMDFRRQCNFGYAFVNFTTAEAARGLYASLQWCGWKVCGSKKVIVICPAKIQGKQALVRHFDRLKLECDTAEFLPAMFSPPRDGVTATAPRRLGGLAPRPAQQAAATATATATTTRARAATPPPKASHS